MRTRRPVEAAQRPDLTPMIDIVFNLIIFFLIVSELSNLAIEELELAYADQATKPREPGRVLQLNVMGDGTAKVKGLAYTTDSTAHDLPPLERFLAIEAAGYDYEASSDPGQGPLSKLRVTLRAAKDGPFQRVQEALDAGQKAGIYQTSFGASKEQR